MDSTKDWPSSVFLREASEKQRQTRKGCAICSRLSIPVSPSKEVGGGGLPTASCIAGSSHQCSRALTRVPVQCPGEGWTTIPAACGSQTAINHLPQASQRTSTGNVELSMVPILMAATYLVDNHEVLVLKDNIQRDCLQMPKRCFHACYPHPLL